MNAEIVEVFVHGKGRPVVVEAQATEVLHDLLARLDALPGDGEFVFVGESRHAHDQPEADKDDHEPVDIKLTIQELDLPAKRHIHTQAVHSIRTTVEFNGQSPTREFRPNATVGTVLAWAKHRLHIDPTAGADYVLELQPSQEIPRLDEHLGDLPGKHHELHFKLVKEVNPQG